VYRVPLNLCVVLLLLGDLELPGLWTVFWIFSISTTLLASISLATYPHQDLLVVWSQLYNSCTFEYSSSTILYFILLIVMGYAVCQQSLLKQLWNANVFGAAEAEDVLRHLQHTATNFCDCHCPHRSSTSQDRSMKILEMSNLQHVGSWCQINWHFILAVSISFQVSSCTFSYRKKTPDL